MKAQSLNLGCGVKYLEDYTNIDANRDVKADLYLDFNVDMLKPIKSNSITRIYSSHTLEHIKPDVYVEFLNEMFRVSKNGAKWELVLPFDNAGGRCNPFHYRAYYFTTFDGFSIDKHRNGVQHTFKLKRLNRLPSKWWRMLTQIMPFLQSDTYFLLEVQK